MLSEFAQDFADPDQPIKEALAERPGKPVKIRVAPMILRSASNGKGQYQAWKQVRWTLEVDTTEEALSVRHALRAFFDTMTRCGPVAVLRALEKLQEKVA